MLSDPLAPGAVLLLQGEQRRGGGGPPLGPGAVPVPDRDGDGLELPDGLAGGAAGAKSALPVRLR